MRIEQFEYITAITEHGSLRRASERLHVSQSAVSEAVAKLEQELGVTLLERRRTGSRISLAGRELLDHIVEILESVDRLRAAATGRHATTRRALRLGTVSAGSASPLLPSIQALQRAHPGTSVEVRNLQQDAIERGLGEGTLEIGLVNLLDGDDIAPDLVATPLRRGKVVVVLPVDHPYARAEAITVDDLRAAPFVAMRPGYLMYRVAQRLFGTERPDDWHASDGADMGKMMVAEGLGPTILPDYSVHGDPLERAGVITTRPVAGDPILVRLVAVHRRQARVPPLIRTLVDLLGSNVASATASAARP